MLNICMFLRQGWCLLVSVHTKYLSSVQSLSHVRLLATPWIAALQASLSITNSRSSLRLTSIELVMPSSHLILCHPLLLLPPVPPSIRVFSSEATLCMRWPKTRVQTLAETRVSALASFLPKKSQGWSPSDYIRYSTCCYKKHFVLDDFVQL